MILDESIIGSRLLEEMILSQGFPSGRMVETGSGINSTPRLAALAERRGRRFDTIDMNPRSVVRFKLEFRSRSGLHAHRTKGEIFLARINEPIAFAYLDSYDWVDSSVAPAGYPKGLSKRESEIVHLEQAMALSSKAPPGGAVLIDDTWFLEKRPLGQKKLRDGTDPTRMEPSEALRELDVFGKGSIAVPFLISAGFDVVAISQRPHPTQVLLVKPLKTELPGVYPDAYFDELLREHRAKKYSSNLIFAKLATLRPPIRLAASSLRLKAYLALPPAGRRLARKFAGSTKGAG